jgi:hypothetical protein
MKRDICNFNFCITFISIYKGKNKIKGNGELLSGGGATVLPFCLQVVWKDSVSTEETMGHGMLMSLKSRGVGSVVQGRRIGGC